MPLVLDLKALKVQAQGLQPIRYAALDKDNESSKLHRFASFDD